MKKKIVLYMTAAVALVVAAVLFDQWTKALAVSYLRLQDDISLIPGVFVLHYLENTGAAFGVLKDRQIFFILFTLIVLAFLCYLLVRSLIQGLRTQKKCFYCLFWSLCFLCAGAIGNLIDRIYTGYVVDFMYIKLIDFPVFNVADCYVTMSIIVIFVTILFFFDEAAISALFQKKGK